MSAALVSCTEGVPQDVRPVLNPAPVKTFRIVVYAPVDYHVRVSASFATARKPHCVYSVGLGVWDSYGKDVPLRLTKVGDHYEATFNPDMFLGGRCEWQFGALAATVAQGPYEFKSAFAYFDGAFRDFPREKNDYNDRRQGPTWHCTLTKAMPRGDDSKSRPQPRLWCEDTKDASFRKYIPPQVAEITLRVYKDLCAYRSTLCRLSLS